MAQGTARRGWATACLLIVVATLMPPLLTAGSAAADGNNKLSVVVRGNDGEVYLKTVFEGGSWGDWIPKGRPQVGVVGGPAIAYRSDDEYVIFVQGDDNALWYRTMTSDWTLAGKPFGRNLAYDPDATMWSDGTAAAFVTDNNNQISYVTVTTDGTLTWTPIAAPFGGATSGPSAVSWNDTDGFSARVFTRDQNGELRSVSYSHNTWSTGASPPTWEWWGDLRATRRAEVS